MPAATAAQVSQRRAEHPRPDLIRQGAHGLHGQPPGERDGEPEHPVIIRQRPPDQGAANIDSPQGPQPVTDDEQARASHQIPTLPAPAAAPATTIL